MFWMKVNVWYLFVTYLLTLKHILTYITPVIASRGVCDAQSVAYHFSVTCEWGYR